MKKYLDPIMIWTIVVVWIIWSVIKSDSKNLSLGIIFIMIALAVSIIIAHIDKKFDEIKKLLKDNCNENKGPKL